MIPTAKSDFHKYTQLRAFPTESVCQDCGFFNTTHPVVQEILRERSDSTLSYEQWIERARCRCSDIAREKLRQEDIRVAEASLPHNVHPRTFQNFKDRPGTEQARSAAIDFATGTGPNALMLVGETGTGKSHLLEAIGRISLSQGLTVRYEVASRLLDHIRHSFSYETKDDLLDVVTWYQSRAMLIIDDLGLAKGSDWAIEQLTSLIDERLRLGKLLAIGTNLNHEEMSEMVGHRLASRLFPRNRDLNEIKLVVLEANDYRRATGT
jgi:putative replication protein